MHITLSDLVERLAGARLSEASVIPWGSPVPSFGDHSSSRVATLGLNPSNREFVDHEGKELNGDARRFHTLSSLGLACWSEVNKGHLKQIADLCRDYFFRNPYDGWFRSLDQIISGTEASYYDASAQACHLDLIPYATECKWTDLSIRQRLMLLDLTGDTLGLLLKDSPIRLLILNGQTVVNSLQQISGVQLEKDVMPEWTLPRRTGSGVVGYAYKGLMNELSGVKLGREIVVLGFNHNIQSSFGVTRYVRDAIQNWVSRMAQETVV